MNSPVYFTENVLNAGYSHGQQRDHGGPACPLTGSRAIQVLEEFPTSLLVECYQRDLGINVASEFLEVQSLQLCRSLDSHLMFFYPAVVGSSSFYEHLQQFDWYYPADKVEYQRAAKWIHAGDRVLDIGCGAGQFSTYIPEASYHGLDPHRLPEINSRHGEPSILSETVSSHAISHSKTYDVVCAFQVLEHMEDPRTFLTAALECLKPNGLLILGVPNAESYITRIPNFVLNAPPHHLTWWTDKALCHLADHFQLSIIDLAHSPVENWETRLYWMQRLAKPLMPRVPSYFSESPLLQWVNIASYMGAGILQHLTAPPNTAQGSTVLMTARKIGKSVCWIGI